MIRTSGRLANSASKLPSLPSEDWPRVEALPRSARAENLAFKAAVFSAALRASTIIAGHTGVVHVVGAVVISRPVSSRSMADFAATRRACGCAFAMISAFPPARLFVEEPVGDFYFERSSGTGTSSYWHELNCQSSASRSVDVK